MKKFKDTFVAKGSALYEATQINDPKERKKLCEKIYKTTKDNAVKCFGQEDYDWFMQFNK